MPGLAQLCGNLSSAGTVPRGPEMPSVVPGVSSDWCGHAVLPGLGWQGWWEVKMVSLRFPWRFSLQATMRPCKLVSPA